MHLAAGQIPIKQGKHHRSSDGRLNVPEDVRAEVAAQSEPHLKYKKLMESYSLEICPNYQEAINYTLLEIIQTCTCMIREVLERRVSAFCSTI